MAVIGVEIAARDTQSARRQLDRTLDLICGHELEDPLCGAVCAQTAKAAAMSHRFVQTKPWPLIKCPALGGAVSLPGATGAVRLAQRL